MTKLLVSVRNAAEAEAALRGGADWIDLKEPAAGPLGAVSVVLANEIAETVHGRAEVSAAAGELLDWPTSPARALQQVAGVAQLKLGLSGCAQREWQELWRTAQSEIAQTGKELVAVMYADHAAAGSPPPADVVSLAIDARARWLLVDTFDKHGDSLLDCLTAHELRSLFQRAQRHGLTTACAGRLTRDVIAALPLDAINVVAVRSAACGGDRSGTVCADQVAALQQILSALQASRGARPRGPAASGRG